MSDDPEIIPPSKGRLPARRDERQNLPGASARVPAPRWVVSSLLTGFQADMQASAYGSIAKNLRAQSDALQADAERHESALKLKRTIHKLEELPEILATDRAERTQERTRQSFEREEADKDRATEADIRAAERERKIWEAKDAAHRAHHRHDATVEFKDHRFKLGQIRADTRRTEAEIYNAQHKSALDAAQGDGAGEREVDLRAMLIEARERALADGNHIEAERLARAIGALEGGEG